jgi:hypothetical protein
MNIVIRILAALPGLLFLVTGVRWLLQPAAAAQGLGMPLLEGIGASTQIGDLGSFFFVNGVLIGLGLLPGKSHLLYAPAFLIGGAGVFRIMAALLGHAPFAPDFIVAEAVMTTILLVAAKRLGAPQEGQAVGS